MNSNLVPDASPSVSSPDGWGATEAAELLERMSEGFYRLDSQWRMTYLNRQAESFLGRPRERLLGTILWEELPHFDGTLLHERFLFAVANQEQVRFEAFDSARGAWLDFRAHPDRNGLAVFFTEAADRRREKASFQILFEEAADAQLVFNQSGCMQCNHAAEELLGFSRDDLRRMRPLAFAPPYQPSGQPSPECAEAHLRAAQVGGRQTFEWAALTADGRELVLEVSLTPMPSEGSDAFLAIFRDRTESERRRREIETFRALVERSSEYIGITDEAGNYRYLNAAGRTLLGMTLQESIVGLNCDAFLHEASVPAWRQAMETACSGGLWSGELMQRPRGGGPPIATEAQVFGVNDPRLGPSICVATVQKDVTVRRAAQERLRESEALFRSIVENSRVVMVTCTVKGDFTYVSRAWQDVMGYSPQSAIGRNVTDYLHPDDLSSFREHLDHVLRDPSYGSNLIYRARAADGEYRWLASHASAVRDAHGQPQYIIGTAVDLSERVRAEQALREIESRLRAVFDQQFQYMALLSPTGIVLDMNDLLLQTTGVAKKEVVGKLLWETPWWRDLPEMQAAWPRRLVEAAMGDEPIRREDPYRASDGEIRYATTSISAVWGADGSVDFIILQGFDVTDRRPEEGDLAKQFRTLKAAAENSESPTALVDAEGRITFVNEAFVALTGWSSVEVIGRIGIDGIVPDAQETLVTHLREGCLPESRVWTLIDRGGSNVPVLIALRPMERDGGFAGGALELQPVTPRLHERNHQLVTDLREPLRSLHEPIEIMKVISLALGEHLHASCCAFVEIDDREICTVTQAWASEPLPPPIAYPLDLEGDAPALRAGRTVVRNRAEPTAAILCPLGGAEHPAAMLAVYADGARAWSEQEVELVEMVAHAAWVEIERVRGESDRRHAYEDLLEDWLRTTDLHDRGGDRRGRRVADLAARLAARLGYPHDKMLHLRRGALLHDVGSIGIPIEILQKPGPLTDAERVEVRRHPEIAWQMLSSIDFLLPALEIPYSHHERWDGSGYPQGLKEKAIPWSARIFAVVDVYDALTSDRPFRVAWTPEKALDYLAEQAGRLFEPAVVEAFLAMAQEEGPL